jgi:hypothetical protein
VTLALATVRQRIETAVDALTDWHPSPMPAELFGRDPSNLAHLSFAVGFGNSEPAGSLVESSRIRRGSNGGDYHTSVVVRFAFRLRQAAVADYDLALAQHDALRVALLGVAGTGGLHLLVAREAREIAPEGPWYIGTTECRATFNLQLQ